VLAAPRGQVLARPDLEVCRSACQPPVPWAGSGLPHVILRDEIPRPAGLRNLRWMDVSLRSWPPPLGHSFLRSGKRGTRGEKQTLEQGLRDNMAPTFIFVARPRVKEFAISVYCLFLSSLYEDSRKNTADLDRHSG